MFSLLNRVPENSMMTFIVRNWRKKLHLLEVTAIFFHFFPLFDLTIFSHLYLVFKNYYFNTEKSHRFQLWYLRFHKILQIERSVAEWDLWVWVSSTRDLCKRIYHWGHSQQWHHCHWERLLLHLRWQRKIRATGEASLGLPNQFFYKSAVTCKTRGESKWQLAKTLSRRADKKASELCWFFVVVFGFLLMGFSSFGCQCVLFAKCFYFESHLYLKFQTSKGDSLI